MTIKSPTYITEASLLTCVVPIGKADNVLRAARDLGVTGGTVIQGRGTGLRELLGVIGIAVESEKEIVSMMIPNERRDILVEALYKAAGMDTLAAGFIYVTPLDKAAFYIPEGTLNILDKGRKS